jgi:predicted Zn-dependent protease
MNRRRWLACVHCSLLAAPLSGWVGSARAQAAWTAPPRFERPGAGSDEGGLWALMDREETRLRRSPFRMRDDGLQDYLQALACKLGADHCPDIRVYPLRTPYFNASMAPNGMMQVWSGLLLRIDNEAQLCAVLAHEIAHFLQRHTLERLRDIKARSAFGTFISMFGVVGLIGAMANVAASFGFSRDQEREADALGLVLMERAGYDPREAAKVWANLIEESSANPKADPAGSTPMFATHPAPLERSRVLADATVGRGGELGTAAYAARLAPLRASLLDDELKRGQWGETLVLMQRLLARDGELPELLYYRGEARRQRGQDGDAELALADLEAATSAPAGAPPQAHRALGYLHLQQQRADAARSSFERYLQRLPDAPDAALIRSYITEGK